MPANVCGPPIRRDQGMRAAVARVLRETDRPGSPRSHVRLLAAGRGVSGGTGGGAATIGSRSGKPVVHRHSEGNTERGTATAVYLWSVPHRAFAAGLRLSQHVHHGVFARYVEQRSKHHRKRSIVAIVQLFGEWRRIRIEWRGRRTPDRPWCGGAARNRRRIGMVGVAWIRRPADVGTCDRRGGDRTACHVTIRTI